MGWLLNAAYGLALLVCSPILIIRSWRDRKYREGLAAKLLGGVPQRTNKDRRCVWFHAVSLGEVNVLAPVIERFRQQRPDLELVISTTTRTGYEAAQRRYGQSHSVFYCPLDFTWAVSRAVRRIEPSLLVLAELELWPNLIRLARSSGAKVAIMNGRLSPKSFRGYLRIRWLTERVFRDVAWVGCQTSVYAQRFISLGASSSIVHVTGSVKFDGAETNRANAETQALKQLVGLDGSETVWVAGSTCEPEEERVLEAFDKLAAHETLRLILVPRHPERFELAAQWVERSGYPWLRRSELAANDPANPGWRILLVDCVGELSAWWGTATIGFVGGSMGARGGQNMIEPSAYGAAVCFGPKTENFRDVVQQLLEVDGATVVADVGELAKYVDACVSDPKRAAEQGARARQLVFSNMGATERTVARLSELVLESSAFAARPAELPQRKSA